MNSSRISLSSTIGNKTHLQNEEKVERGHEIPHPPTHREITPPLPSESDELEDPTTMVRSLTPSMGPELDPTMKWLQEEEESKRFLLVEPKAPIAKPRTRPPRQLRSRTIGTVNWIQDVEQYGYVEDSKPKQWTECLKTQLKDDAASSSFYPSTQIHRDVMKSSYWQLLYDPTLDRVNRRSKIEREAVAMQINNRIKNPNMTVCHQCSWIIFWREATQKECSL